MCISSETVALQYALATLGYRYRLKDVLLRGPIHTVMYLSFSRPRVSLRGLVVAV